MHYLGIDISKAKSDYLLLDEKGQKVSASFALENSRPGFETLMTKLAALGALPGETLAGVEATGPFWHNLYGFLSGRGYQTVVLNPYQTRRYQQTISNKVKTDASSAFVVADLLRTGRYLASSVPEEKIEALRELMKFQHQQEEQKKTLVRRITATLAVVFPEYGETAIANVSNVCSREILRRFPTACDIADASARRIEKLARTIKGNNLSVEKIVHLVDTARNSIYSGRARQARGLTLKLLVQELDSVLAALQEVKAEIEKIFTPDGENGSFPGENLLTIPGVGKKTAASFMAVAGFNGENFPSGVELVGYIGYFPRISQSGNSQWRPVISSQGPRFIRHSLYIAAVSCLRHNLELKSLYNRKVSQGKSPKEAIICVAKKLAHLMLSLLKTGEDYRPERVFVPPTALRHFHQAIHASS